MPSTKSASTNKSIVQVGEASPIDQQVDQLERRLSRSEDQRLEERFLWFVFSGALFMVLAFMAAGAAAGGAVTLLYFGMLLVLSRRWGFEDLWEALYAAKELLRTSKDKKKPKS